MVAFPPFSRQNPHELVIFCGSPGSGKSTYYWNTLEPLEYERVNQDTLKSVSISWPYPYLPVPHTTRPGQNETYQSHQRPKCLKVAKEYLESGKSVAVGMPPLQNLGHEDKTFWEPTLLTISTDNTNADPETRAHWVNLAKELEVPIRCIHFNAAADLCRHNNAARAANRDLVRNLKSPSPGMTLYPSMQVMDDHAMSDAVYTTEPRIPHPSPWNRVRGFCASVPRAVA